MNESEHERQEREVNIKERERGSERVVEVQQHYITALTLSDVSYFLRKCAS